MRQARAKAIPLVMDADRPKNWDLRKATHALGEKNGDNQKHVAGPNMQREKPLKNTSSQSTKATRHSSGQNLLCP